MPVGPVLRGASSWHTARMSSARSAANSITSSLWRACIAAEGSSDEGCSDGGCGGIGGVGDGRGMLGRARPRDCPQAVSSSQQDLQFSRPPYNLPSNPPATAAPAPPRSRKLEERLVHDGAGVRVGEQPRPKEVGARGPTKQPAEVAHARLDDARVEDALVALQEDAPRAEQPEDGAARADRERAAANAVAQHVARHAAHEVRAHEALGSEPLLDRGPEIVERHRVDEDVWDGGVQEACSDEPVVLWRAAPQQHVVLGEQIEDASPLHRDQERRTVANEDQRHLCAAIEVARTITAPREGRGGASDHRWEEAGEEAGQQSCPQPCHAAGAAGAGGAAGSASGWPGARLGSFRVRFLGLPILAWALMPTLCSSGVPLVSAHFSPPSLRWAPFGRAKIAGTRACGMADAPTGEGTTPMEATTTPAADPVSSSRPPAMVPSPN
eukprot:scaffold124482_cov63-Phaeocystis_antarctica.AAC.2